MQSKENIKQGNKQNFRRGTQIFLGFIKGLCILGSMGENILSTCFSLGKLAGSLLQGLSLCRLAKTNVQRKGETGKPALDCSMERSD